MAREDQPLILAVESATRAGSVCLVRGEDVLASISGDESASHSTDLIENIDALIRENNLTLGDVDLFAAASGPGSFTGLRIGLATVKSIAACMRRPCVGISTLAAIAYAAGASVQTVALLPAGRGEVFAQMFSVDQSEAQALDRPAHLGAKALWERYGSFPEIKWTGESTLIDRTLSGKEGNSSAISWIKAPLSGALAASIALLALGEFRKGKIVSPAELRASYVRASDAEINERWQSPKPERSIPS